MSSAGLIWKHFGLYILPNLINAVITSDNNIKELPSVLNSVELIEFCKEKMCD